MRKVICFMVVLILAGWPVQTQAQVLYYGGAPYQNFSVPTGSSFGGWWGGPGTYQFKSNQFDVGPTLARNLPWAVLLGYLGHKYVGLKEKELKVEGGYAVAELDGGRKVLVHRTGLNTYSLHETTQGRVDHAVPSGPPVEQWNGKDWGSGDPKDREIQEMLDEARLLERKAGAMERLTDAQQDLEKARRYREERKPVAAIKPVSNGDERDKKLEELKKEIDSLKKLLQQEQKTVPLPATPSEKEVPVDKKKSGFREDEEWIKKSLPDPYDPGFEKTPPEGSPPPGFKLVGFKPGPYGIAPVYLAINQ